MLGGIIGDVIGSVYEGRQWVRKDLKLLQKLPLDDKIAVPVLKNTDWCRKKYGWTDDTLCTLALYKAYIENTDYADTLQSFCNSKMNEHTGFGKAFKNWLLDKKPYNSYANGSIMRIGFIPFLNELSLDQKLVLGYNMTKISHNHIDSYNAVNNYIVLCDELVSQFKRGVKNKKFLKDFLDKNKFNKTVKDMHKEKSFEINALKTLYQSIAIVYESNSFEEALRNSFYVGGDSDTIATIVGNISSLVYTIPDNAYRIIELALRDDQDMIDLVKHFKNNKL